MKARQSVCSFALILLAITAGPACLGAENPVIPLWPGIAPGETNVPGVEKDMTKPGDNQIAGKPVIRLGNVSQPTITVYRAAKEKHAGAAVLVFPGGGYNILAMDLEGTEV